MKRPRAYLRSRLYAAPPPELPAPTTPVGAVIAARRRALVADLGGEEALSEAQRALVDVALRSWLVLDGVDAYLCQLPCPVDRRHRRVWPVVLDRARLAAQLESTLGLLGLDRKAKPVKPLDAYLADVARTAAE